MEKNMKSNLKKKSSKPWIFSHSAGWKKLKKQPNMSQQQRKSLNEQNVPSKVSSTNNPNTINLTPDMEIIKVTTIIEAIRRKRQRSTQIPEGTRNIQKIVGKKRSKRSSYESGKNSMTTRNLRYAREKKASTSNERFGYPKRYYHEQQKELFPKKYATDHELRTASSVTMPSNVFYKRIWEYINGTRPHSDINSDYSFLKNNSKKDNSTCIDKDKIASSPSRTSESQAISPNIKPERELYKRIWDLINATRSTHDNVKSHSKRNVNIPKNKTLAAISTQLCTQEIKANREEDKQIQATNKKSTLDITNMTDSQEISEYDILGLWADVNKTKTKRQPETAISTENVKFNNNSILSHASTASASEVEDLNKFPDKVESKIDHSSTDNSTKNINKVRDKLQEIREKPTPLPYVARQENFTASNDNVSQAQTKYAENYSTDTTPAYDPANIPYVEVPDYSDQREESLDKSDQNLTAANKEYDDNDYVDLEQKPPKLAGIKIQDTNDESEISMNADISYSRCAENSDSAECADNVGNSKLHEDNTSDNDSTEEDSAELALSEESENSTADFVHFDINKYKKPFYLDYFINDNPILKNIKAEFDKENIKYESDKSADYSEESEEFEPYATYPKEFYDYFTKNQNYGDHYGIMFNEKNKGKKNSDVYAKEETKGSEVSNEDHYSDDKDFLKHIFEEDNDKESSNMADAEKEFLSRYFTEDVLRQLKENSTAEEHKRREKSKNREDIHKTLSKILDKKDRFSRLDENLNEMIKEGQTTPIRYKNFWSLEYELPRMKNKAEEESEV